MHWSPQLTLLLQTGAHIMSDEMHEVWCVDIERGMDEQVDSMLAAGVDVNARYGKDRDTALHALARAGASWEECEQLQVSVRHGTALMCMASMSQHEQHDAVHADALGF